MPRKVANDHPLLIEEVSANPRQSTVHPLRVTVLPLAVTPLLESAAPAARYPIVTSRTAKTADTSRVMKKDRFSLD